MSKKFTAPELLSALKVERERSDDECVRLGEAAEAMVNAERERVLPLLREQRQASRIKARQARYSHEGDTYTYLTGAIDALNLLEEKIEGSGQPPEARP